MRAGPLCATGSTTAVCRERPWTALHFNACSTRFARAEIDIIVVYKVDRSRAVRRARGFLRLGHPVVQHHLQHGTADAQRSPLLRPVRAGGDRRARDKIAASKRKGLWVGGPVALAYRSVGKKLEIAPDEADLVRKIFAEYLRLGSIGSANKSSTSRMLNDLGRETIPAVADLVHPRATTAPPKTPQARSGVTMPLFLLGRPRPARTRDRS